MPRLFLSAFGVLIACITTIGHSQQSQPGPDHLPPIRFSVDRSAMVRAFDEGRLPAPLPLPTGSMDEVAGTLARTIAQGGLDATPALVTALLAAGYAIRGMDANDQSLVQLVRPGQGLVLDGWTVALMAKEYAGGRSIRLETLSASLATAIPVFQGVPVTPAILAAVRTHATSPLPARRFLARFLVELGRASDRPYDMLASVPDTASVYLDPIQRTLILLRLAADGLGSSPDRPRARVDVGAVVQPVRFRPHASLMEASTSPSGGVASACSPEEQQSLILDLTAKSESALFAYLWELAAHGSETGERVIKSLQAAAALSTIAKLLITYKTLEIDFAMDAPRLVRTKNFTPGERRMLTATVRANTGKWSLLNCFRFMLNLIGADADVPNDGRLSGVGVEWRLVQGGVGRLSDYSWDQIRTNPSLVLPIVQFEATTPDGARVSPSRHVTNGAGTDRIFITGVPQAEDLTRRPVTAVDKSFTVQVDVQIKHPEPGSPKDGIDILGTVLPQLIAGEVEPVGLVSDGLGETMLRLHMPGSYRTFPVVDWEACKEWSGGIRYNFERHYEHNEEDRFHKFHKDTHEGRTSSTRIVKTLSDRGPSPSGDRLVVFEVAATGVGSVTSHTAGTNMSIRREPNDLMLCGRGSSDYSVKGFGNLADGKASLRIRGDGSYTLEFEPIEVAMNGTHRSDTFTAAGCGYGFKDLTSNAFSLVGATKGTSWAGHPETVNGHVNPADTSSLDGLWNSPPTVGLNGEARTTVSIEWHLRQSCKER